MVVRHFFNVARNLVGGLGLIGGSLQTAIDGDGDGGRRPGAYCTARTLPWPGLPLTFLSLIILFLFCPRACLSLSSVVHITGFAFLQESVRAD